MHTIIRLLVNCERCGWCCTIPRTVPDTEVASIAVLCRESFDSARKKLNDYPCGYLYNHECTINDIKPSVCRWYPGPDAKCKAYQELAEKIYIPGAMHRVCNEPELKDLYVKVVLTGSKEAAYKILDILGIKL